MTTTILIIIMLLFLTLSVALCVHTTNKFHKEIKTYCDLIKSDSGKRYNELRDSYCHLNATCISLLSRIRSLRNDLDELTAGQNCNIEIKVLDLDKILPHDTTTCTTTSTNLNREHFVELREKGKSVQEAGKQIGVSPTTAKRYEKWRKEQEKK